jgi:hypothetical protein
MPRQVEFNEFVHIVAVMKQLSLEAQQNPSFALETFGPAFLKRSNHASEVVSNSVKGVHLGADVGDFPDTAWNRAVERLEKQSLDQTWDAIFDALNAAGHKQKGNAQTCAVSSHCISNFCTMLLISAPLSSQLSFL